MTITRRKAFAYITNRGRLLLLFQPDYPEAGIQVPAGTMEPGEAPEEAVLREAREETDLDDLAIVRPLGRYTHDMRPWGRDEFHDRWVFHLRSDQEMPEVWQTMEMDAFDGSPPILLELRWVDLDALPSLSIGHDRFIPELIQSIALDQV